MKFLLIVFAAILPGKLNSQTKTDSNIYDRIIKQLHSCFLSGTIKDSAKRKSYCYDLVLQRNYDELKTYGIDTTKNKDFKRYYDLYLKRFKNNNAHKAELQEVEKDYGKDESFIGSLIKEKQLANGQYEITLKSTDKNISQKTVSKNPINKNELKRFTPGEDNIIISFHQNIVNGKEENIVKSIFYLGTEKNEAQ